MADVGNWASFCEIFLFPGEARNPKVDGFKHTHTHTHTHIGIQVKVFKNIVQSRHKCDCRVAYEAHRLWAEPPRDLNSTFI